MLTALHRGDQSLLFDLRAALPKEQRKLLQQVMDGAQVGRWPERITDDRRLWGLLSALWKASIRAEGRQDRLIDPNLGAFYAWQAYRTAHGRILAGDLDGALRQVKLFRRNEAIDERIDVEVDNLRAYLSMRPDNRRREDLERAERLLNGAVDGHPQVRRNLALVRERRQTPSNNRESWEDLYVALGLPHGDPRWTERWRELSRRHRDDVLLPEAPEARRVPVILVVCVGDPRGRQ
ncbi:hypothetical protein AB0L25_36840 [Spirillospora sp. NPDC052242]